jgi:nitrogen fixation NifU-like protein
MLDELYKEIILEQSMNPQNKKLLVGNKIKTSKQENTFCGDSIFLNVKIENDKIIDVGWDGNGCAISMASVSVMSELIKNKSIKDTKILLKNFENMLHSEPFNKDILEDAVSFEGTKKFPMRIKCALLGWMGLKNILYP